MPRRTPGAWPVLVVAALLCAAPAQARVPATQRYRPLPPVRTRLQNEWYMYRALQGRPVVTAMPPNLKVAYLGDMGLASREPDVGRVLRLIKARRASAVVHVGDLDYHGQPAEFEEQINSVLGENYPYFITPGNHEGKFHLPDGHQHRFERRMRRLQRRGIVNCTGEAAVHTLCSFRGLMLILSGYALVGYPDDFAEPYIQEHLETCSDQDALWVVCAWHRAPGELQLAHAHERLVAFREGYDAFDLCRHHGAMVVTAHAHIYTRTHTLSDFRSKQVQSRDLPVVLAPGQSVHTVVGTGGFALMNFDPRYMRNGRDELATVPKFFAAAYGASSGLAAGALFCTYNVNGVRNRAFCQYEDIHGRVLDAFPLVSLRGSRRAPPSPPVPPKWDCGQSTVMGREVRCSITGVAGALPEQFRVMVALHAGDARCAYVTALNTTNWGQTYDFALYTTCAATLDVTVQHGGRRLQTTDGQPSRRVQFIWTPATIPPVSGQQHLRLYSVDEVEQLYAAMRPPVPLKEYVLDYPPPRVPKAARRAAAASAAPVQPKREKRERREPAGTAPPPRAARPKADGKLLAAREELLRYRPGAPVSAYEHRVTLAPRPATPRPPAPRWRAPPVVPRRSERAAALARLAPATAPSPATPIRATEPTRPAAPRGSAPVRATAPTPAAVSVPVLGRRLSLRGFVLLCVCCLVVVVANRR